MSRGPLHMWNPYRVAHLLQSLETMLRQLKLHIKQGDFARCSCGHYDCEHIEGWRVRFDPGKRPCLVKGCDCDDFDEPPGQENELRSVA